MSDSFVSQLVTNFKEAWNPYLDISPLLHLDDTWPTLGVIDLFTFPLRLQDPLSREQHMMLKGCTCYLARMLEQCWGALGAEVSLENSAVGVSITAQGGKHIPSGEKVSLNLEQVFRKTHAELPFPFPVLADKSVMINFDGNIMGLFGLGIFTGLHPAIDGVWKGRSVEEHSAVTDLVVRELARQSAENYARIFPKEELGQVAELYLQGLIYPPFGLDEEPPALAAVEGLCKFAEEYKISKERMKLLALNLSRSPNESFSSVGVALAVALWEGFPPPELVAAAQAKGNTVGLLRPAMVKAREKFSGTKDWMLGGVRTDAEQLQVEIEAELGFLPWLVLSAKRLREGADDKRIAELLRALCSFDLAEATSIASKFVEEEPADIEMRLQRIKLEMAQGKFPEAQQMFLSLVTEPESDSFPMFFHLWGMCSLELQDPSAALKYFKAGLNMGNVDPRLKSSLANNCAWSSIIKGELFPAMEYIDMALSDCSAPVTTLLNKAHLLWRLGRANEIEPIRRKLFELAPADRRVFATLIHKAD